MPFLNEYMKALGKSHHFEESQQEILLSWLDKNKDKRVGQEEIQKMYKSHLADYS